MAKLVQTFSIRLESVFSVLLKRYGVTIRPCSSSAWLIPIWNAHEYWCLIEGLQPLNQNRYLVVWGRYFQEDYTGCESRTNTSRPFRDYAWRVWWPCSIRRLSGRTHRWPSQKMALLKFIESYLVNRLVTSTSPGIMASKFPIWKPSIYLSTKASASAPVSSRTPSTFSKAGIIPWIRNCSSNSKSLGRRKCFKMSVEI